MFGIVPAWTSVGAAQLAVLQQKSFVLALQQTLF
jgi:hypothetical protein